ncbi:CBN-TOS-1 protein [Caenorhabditis brenneri]|uniref:CBN-TOS-1 protein n=1 Tax=Caenorhabditis brenneri TaxID=135651 RepID=G0NTU7_CAEBE|nr:CBN-TOS-1 protein [Caenorhabditis brenneri]
MHYQFESSSPSSSSDDESYTVAQMRPTDLLSLAMKKRRDLFNQKERNMRCEVLQTSFITSLCKHMGESRRRHRRGGKKRSRSTSSKVSSTFSDITPIVVKPNNNVEPLVQNEQQHITMEPDVKRFKVNSFMDPFGLEEFFKNISSRDIKGEHTLVIWGFSIRYNDIHATDKCLMSTAATWIPS